jgi:Protein of unknown function (DUF4235)
MARDSSNARVIQTLKHAAGMAAAGAYKGLQVVWKQVTGKEPPLGPDDQQAPLGRAIVWTLMMGAAVTTARMVVIRYASRLLPGGQQQDMTDSASAALADNPDSSTA